VPLSHSRKPERAWMVALCASQKQLGMALVLACLQYRYPPSPGDARPLSSLLHSSAPSNLSREVRQELVPMCREHR
jgi:hypothetical protein